MQIARRHSHRTPGQPGRSIFVVAGIGQRGEKLAEQVPVGGMDLEDIEPASLVRRAASP